MLRRRVARPKISAMDQYFKGIGFARLAASGELNHVEGQSDVRDRALDWHRPLLCGYIR